MYHFASDSDYEKLLPEAILERCQRQKSEAEALRGYTIVTYQTITLLFSHWLSFWHFWSGITRLIFMIFQFLRAFHSTLGWGSKVGDEWLWSGFTTHSGVSKQLVESVKYGQLYWRFPIQRQAGAKCNREVGSQIENLRVVIVITGQRFILLDSFNRSAGICINAITGK